MKKIILALVLIIILTIFSMADIYMNRVKNTEAYEPMEENRGRPRSKKYGCQKINLFLTER